MKKSEHLQLGKRGEDAAEEFLLAKGFHILFRNYRFQKAEVDIVASYKNLLVLIEVKTRRSNNFGNPEEFVSKRKQELFYEVSEAYGAYMAAKIPRRDVDELSKVCST